MKAEIKEILKHHIIGGDCDLFVTEINDLFKEKLSEVKKEVEDHLKLTEKSKIYYAMVDENGVYAIDKFLQSILSKLKTITDDK